MKNLNRFVITTLIMTAFAFAFLVVARAQPSVDLSGYEFRLGRDCTIDGLPAKCDVQFGGWTGGGGPVAGGWTPFPGDDKGLWKAKVNYRGTVDFNSKVDILSGSFDVLFKNGSTVSGTVTGGTVEWPIEGDNIGCGTDVATVSVSLTTKGGSTVFAGCLHDLPAGTVIPPKIWGRLY